MKRFIFIAIMLASVTASAQIKVFDTIKFYRGGKLYKLLLYNDSLVINGYKYYSYPYYGSPPATSQWVTSGSNIYYNIGNVGIGLTNPGPSYKLYVINTNAAIAGVSTSSSGITGTSTSGFGGNFATSSGTGIRVSSTYGYAATFTAGNVGVGTLGPAQKVHVIGNIGLNGTEQSLNIGDTYQGGIVVRIFSSADLGYDPNVQKGLVCASSDQSVSAPWGCNSVYISTSNAAGAGQSNTNNILAGCSTVGIAAYICDTLTLGGYTDWYLPTDGDLNYMYYAKSYLNMDEDQYWSSTQQDYSRAHAYDFVPYTISSVDKSQNKRVRAIRTFTNNLNSIIKPAAIGIGTTAPSGALDINSDILRLRTAKTPASASATGNAGDICWDADYIYVCTATDTWKRVAIASW